LLRKSNQLANAQAILGGCRGDRVAILLPQMPEVGTKCCSGTCPACSFRTNGFRRKAIAYGPRSPSAISQSANSEPFARLESVRAGLPELALTVSTDGPGALGVEALLADASADFAAVATTAEEPALMIYTSGTTGPPKRALHRDCSTCYCRRGAGPQRLHPAGRVTNDAFEGRRNRQACAGSRHSYDASCELIAEIQNFVRAQLAAMNIPAKLPLVPTCR
jgi:acyl-coenzyme A synthetase/AMP-(fatty) acid ligase